MNIEAICFDLGGVLVRLRPGFDTGLLQVATPEEQASLSLILRDQFRTGQTEYSASERYQLGLITTEEYLRTVCDALSGRIAREEVLAGLMSEIDGECQEVADLLPTLAKSYRLGCFSNTCAIHWDFINQKFSWMQHFQVKQASHLAGVAKPSAQAFERLCSDLRVAPESCVFIDDRDSNVEAANAFGMNGVLYCDVATLRKDLTVLGVTLERAKEIRP